MSEEPDACDLVARLSVVEALLLGLADALRRSDRKASKLVDEAFACAEDLLTAQALDADSRCDHAARICSLRVLETHRLAIYSD